MAFRQTRLAYICGRCSNADDGVTRLLDKWLRLQFLLLWVLIGVVRMLLAWGLTAKHLSQSEVSVLTLVFIPILLSLEGLILLRGVQTYLSKPFPKRKTWDFVEPPPSRWKLRSAWLNLILLIFALPYGLWHDRFDSGVSGSILVGSAMNLLFVCALADAVAVYKKREIHSRYIAGLSPAVTESPETETGR